MFRILAVSVRDSARYLIGNPSVHPIEGTAPAAVGAEFRTMANVRGYVRRELGAITSYWRVEVIDADGVVIGAGVRAGRGGTGKRWDWSGAAED